MVVFALSLFGFGTVEAPAPVAPENPYFLRQRSGQPEAVALAIESAPARDYIDSIDLGTAYVWQGQYGLAAGAYEVAARAARTHEEVAGALYAKAVAQGYAGDVDGAALTASALVELTPTNDEAAWLRLAMVRHQGDALAQQVAWDHVLRVDPGASGHDVFDPITATAVVAGVAIVTAGVTAVTMTALVPPDDRKDVVVPLFNGFVSVTQASVRPLAFMVGQSMFSEGDLGRELMLQ